MQEAHTPVEVFCSCAHEDEAWLYKLEAHLSSLKRQGFLSLWHSRLIEPGVDWARSVDTHIERASIILLLISADFLASDYCYGVEMKQALERHSSREARVIPILVRPVDWKGTPFAHLSVLPVDARALTAWENEDTALADVAAGIRRIVEDLPLLGVSVPRHALPTIWNVPYPRNIFFVGRDGLLLHLYAQFHSNQPALSSSTPRAISGLGGIGKTQVAVEYAYRYHQHYQVVLWTQADSQETLISSYMTIAKLLKLPELDAQEQSTSIQAVKHWLHTHSQWLLILDNAEDLALLSGFLPPSIGGHVLVTTRIQAMGRLAVRVEEMKTLSSAQGALFLLQRSGRLASDALLEAASSEDRVLAVQIAHEVGGLPLALDQAGAYLEETGCGLDDYLRMYHQRRFALLNERGGIVSDHPQPVATTWALSFTCIRDTNPAAEDILRICAFLQPEAIPEEVLFKGAHYLGPSIQLLAADPFAFHQALKALRAYSLIQRHPGTRMLSVHQLVQAVIIDEMDQATMLLWAERVVKAVDTCLPLVDHTTWATYEQYLAHAQKCVMLIEQLKLTGEAAVRLPQCISFYLHERARYAESEIWHNKSLQIRERILGVDHPGLASPLNGLAYLYREQGRYVEAELLFQRALHLRIQNLGEENPQTARSYNNLAVVYRQQGQYDRAKPLFEQALRIWKQTLGPEHSYVAWPLQGLAILYREQKKYYEASVLFQQAVSIRVQSLGNEHPLVAESLNGLAGVFSDQGQYIEAVQLYTQAITMRENALGPEHPKTAASLQGLAIVHWKQGNHSEAEPLFQRALGIFERMLGPHHPDTQAAREIVTSFQHEMGQD